MVWAVRILNSTFDVNNFPMVKQFSVSDVLNLVSTVVLWNVWRKTITFCFVGACIVSTAWDEECSSVLLPMIIQLWVKLFEDIHYPVHGWRSTKWPRKKLCKSRKALERNLSKNSATLCVCPALIKTCTFC